LIVMSDTELFPSNLFHPLKDILMSSSPMFLTQTDQTPSTPVVPIIFLVNFLYSLPPFAFILVASCAFHSRTSIVSNVAVTPVLTVSSNSLLLGIIFLPSITTSSIAPFTYVSSTFELISLAFWLISDVLLLISLTMPSLSSLYSVVSTLLLISFSFCLIFVSCLLTFSHLSINLFFLILFLIFFFFFANYV